MKKSKTSVEEVIWKPSELQYRVDHGDWLDVFNSTNQCVEYRIKPKPDYSKEMEELQERAKQIGFKINFEKL